MNKLTAFPNEKIFSRLVSNKSNKNYWNYIRELRKRKTEAIFNKAIELTNSAIDKEKIIGIDILTQFGYPRVHLKKILTIFFRMLQIETDKKVLSSLLYGIGHNNEALTDQQLQILCSYQNHKSTDVRFSLAVSLSGIEKTKAITTLIQLSKDKDTDVRNWATFGLGTQIEVDNELIREALWKRVNDNDEVTRDEAIFGLAKRKDERIKEILKKELENIDELGSLILEAIETFNDKDFINLIEKQILENKKGKKVNEDWLQTTLTKLKEVE